MTTRRPLPGRSVAGETLTSASVRVAVASWPLSQLRRPAVSPSDVIRQTWSRHDKPGRGMTNLVEACYSHWSSRLRFGRRRRDPTALPFSSIPKDPCDAAHDVRSLHIVARPPRMSSLRPPAFSAVTALFPCPGALIHRRRSCSEPPHRYTGAVSRAYSDARRRALLIAATTTEGAQRFARGLGIESVGVFGWRDLLRSPSTVRRAARRTAPRVSDCALS